jgi:hypothetical protein
MLHERTIASEGQRSSSEAQRLGIRGARRVLSKLRRAAETPSGKLSEVFTSDRERDAAYDFVERDQTRGRAVGGGGRAGDGSQVPTR